MSKNPENSKQKEEIKQEPQENNEKSVKDSEEVAKLKETLLVMLANSENQRKRHEKELEEMRKYANKKLIRQILPFLNSYEQALELSGEMKDSKVSSFLEGFRMMLKDF